jgi:hypothetical protein
MSAEPTPNKQFYSVRPPTVSEPCNSPQYKAATIPDSWTMTWRKRPQIVAKQANGVHQQRRLERGDR